MSTTVLLVDRDSAKPARLRPRRPAPVAPTDPKRKKHNRISREDPLPLVLAGPIVRRVDPQRAWFWLATSVPVEVTAWVKDASVHQDLGRASTTSMMLGRRLHIVLIGVEPADSPGQCTPFPTDKILAYNMQLQLGSGAEDWILDGEAALKQSDVALDPYSLPTFVIPERRKLPKIIHASCRKLHGIGDDALPRALRHVKIRADQPLCRPSALLLTGDQIYADDVHPALIGPVAKLGRRLLGRDERLPGDKRPVRKIKAKERGEVVGKNGFTVDESHGENHLLGFGDYAAMYLLSWSPDVWQRFVVEVGATKRQVRMGTYGSLTIDITELKVDPKQTRQLLANIPTYMIFDDHEVTDDWNLTYEWVDGVKNNATTRRVVANGLAAFWAFQACGNDPGKDASVQSAVTNGGVSGSAFEPVVWNHHGWGFVADTVPAVFLNTRTQRELEQLKGTGQWAPGLMNKKALTELAAQLRGMSADVDPLLMVSPAPVIGYEFIEGLQRDFSDINKPGDDVDPGKDPEAWSLHPKVFLDFMTVLLNSGRERIVFLSGDVHYGFTTFGRFTEFRKGKRRHFDFVQLTSSATKNEPSWSQKQFMRTTEDSKIQVRRLPLVATQRRVAKPADGSWDIELRWRFYQRRKATDDVDDEVLIPWNNIGVVMIRPGSAGAVAQLAETAKGTYRSLVKWNEFEQHLGLDTKTQAAKAQAMAKQARQLRRTIGRFGRHR